MEHLIKGMQKSIIELITWKGANPDVPEVVNRAINSYRIEMTEAIEKMQKPPYEEGDRVELISNSFEDSGHSSGDTGSVLHVKAAALPCGTMEYELRIEWDNGAEECWIGAENFSANG